MPNEPQWPEADVPFVGRFHHSRAEKIADGIVHSVGLALAIVAGTTLLALSAFCTGTGEYVAAVFYVVSLLSVLSVSLVYNLWPISPAKWLLRRVDHAGIFLLIAASYTPFLAQIDDVAAARWMIAFVWSAAAMGMALKIFLPGRLDRLAVAFYLAIGWSGVMVARPLMHTLPPTTLWLIIASGIVYSLGVVFFVWQRLRFQSALWHGFVVTGAGLHFAAMVDCLVIVRL